MSKRFLPQSAAVVLSVALAGVFVGCSGCTGGGGESAPAASSGAAAPAAGGAAAGAMGKASISGTVSVAGTVAAPATIDMSGTTECAAAHPGGATSEAVLVKDGKVQNAIVFVKSGLGGGYTAPATAATLDQKGCMYSPHVMCVMTGQELKVHNADPVTHNVHADPEKNDSMNAGQPPGSPDISKKFKKPEIIKFKCDVHNWMSSYVGVFDHPFFAVTDASGKFTISGLPAGTYEIEVWHEKFPKQKMSVTVGATDAKTDANFTLKQE